MSTKLNELWHDFVFECAELDRKIDLIRDLDMLAYMEPNILQDLDNIQNILRSHRFSGVKRAAYYKDLLTSYDIESRTDKMTDLNQAIARLEELFKAGKINQ